MGAAAVAAAAAAGALFVVVVVLVVPMSIAPLSHADHVPGNRYLIQSIQ